MQQITLNRLFSNRFLNIEVQFPLGALKSLKNKLYNIGGGTYMIEANETLFISPNFKDILTRGNKYEDYVLDLMNLSNIIFPSSNQL